MRTEIEVAGVKEALRELNEMDKRARRQLTRDFKEIMKPLTMDAERLIPDKAPLSGFDRSWTPKGSSTAVLPFTGTTTAARQPRKPTAREMNYTSGRKAMGQWLRWDAGLRTYVSGKRPQTVGSYTRNLSAFGLRWQGPAAVLFDTSGQASTTQGARMVSALQARFGAPSRVMWRAWETGGDKVEANVKRLVRDLMRRTGRKIQLEP